VDTPPESCRSGPEPDALRHAIAITRIVKGKMCVWRRATQRSVQTSIPLAPTATSEMKHAARCTQRSTGHRAGLCRHSIRRPAAKPLQRRSDRAERARRPPSTLAGTPSWNSALASGASAAVAAAVTPHSSIGWVGSGWWAGLSRAWPQPRSAALNSSKALSRSLFTMTWSKNPGLVR